MVGRYVVDFVDILHFVEERVTKNLKKLLAEIKYGTLYTARKQNKIIIN